MERKDRIIARHSALFPRYLHAWDAWAPDPHKTAHWLPHKRGAKRFTDDQARRVIRALNDLVPSTGALCGAYVERVP